MFPQLITYWRRVTRSTGGWRALHEAEEGTMAQVTVIVMLGFTVLVGLVGNVGRIVQQKLEVQNAADAVAYSTSLWQARSLNAVTAINHLMGEVTAICVLHEALGGPELDDGKEQNSKEFADLNRRITTYRPVAAVVIHLPGLANVDQQVITQVRKIVTYNEGNNGRTLAGATLYDSRITLKQLVAFFQDVKVLGNVLIDVGKTPITAFLVPIGVGMHVIATPAMLKCGIEYGMLMVVEAGARLFVIPKRLLEHQLLPLLAKYSDDLVTSQGKPVANPLMVSVRNTVDELKTRHNVDAEIFPAPLNLRIPLVAEAEPKTASGQKIRSRSVDSGWPAPINALFRSVEFAADVIDFFNSVVKWIPGADEITGFFRPVFPPPDSTGADGNFSKKTLETINADWKTEETTQWVRATYPWVDSLRAPVIGGFKSSLVLSFSKAGVWYGHWTNRFTLAKSHAYRTGKPLSKTAGSLKKMKMYVMKDMKPDRKGREPWATNSQRAERMFTVMAFTSRRVDPIFSPNLYGSAGHDQIVYSQSMVYNANEQIPSGPGSTQPRIGWDTLNWAPPVNVPEYGSKPTERSSLWPPWAIFQKKPASNTPKIKLNWQAKLVPVTRSRLTDALTTGFLDGKVSEAVLKSIPTTKQLDTH